MATSAKCPYCSKTVQMTHGHLGDHRVVGGICDGSQRRVINMEVGTRRAMLEAPHVVMMGSEEPKDMTGQTVRVGDRLSVSGGPDRKNENSIICTVTAILPGEVTGRGGANHGVLVKVRTPSGSEMECDPSICNKV